MWHVVVLLLPCSGKQKLVIITSWCWRTCCCIIVVVMLLPCRGERTLSDHEKLVLEDMLLCHCCCIVVAV